MSACPHRYVDANDGLRRCTRGCRGFECKVRAEARTQERREEERLNAIGQLVQRLAEQNPPHWCLISATGRCWVGPDPLALVIQAEAAR
jgi:hypothetical protein